MKSFGAGVGNVIEKYAISITFIDKSYRRFPTLAKRVNSL